MNTKHTPRLRSFQGYCTHITDAAARMANAERKQREQSAAAYRASIQPELDALAKEADAAFLSGDSAKQREVGAKIDALVRGQS